MSPVEALAAAARRPLAVGFAALGSRRRLAAQTMTNTLRRLLEELQRADRHRVRCAGGARQAEIRDLQRQRESGAGHHHAARQRARRALYGRRRQARHGSQEGRRRPDRTPRPRPRSPTPEAAPAAQSGGNAQITKIEAKGDVVITSDKDQTTTSDWALYDLPAQLVTVGGNVVLTQGENVLKGDRLVIDLKTGESRFENTGNTAAGGRIRALFMPKDAARRARRAMPKPSLAGKSADGSREERLARRCRAGARRDARRHPLTMSHGRSRRAPSPEVRAL